MGKVVGDQLITKRGCRTKLREGDIVLFHLDDGTVSFERGEAQARSLVRYGGDHKFFLIAGGITPPAAFACAKLLAAACGLSIEPLCGYHRNCSAYRFVKYPKTRR